MQFDEHIFGLGWFNQLETTSSVKNNKSTLPETNIAPKNDGFQ